MADSTSRASRVVSIDPGDEEQVRALAIAYIYDEDRFGAPSSRMRRALETLLSKPKPEEPTKVGAVVRDGGAVSFLAEPSDPRCPWRSLNGLWRNWDDFSDDVEILFPGVDL